MKKAVVFFADGMEECEALLVVDLLRRGGINVITAAVGGSLDLLSSHQVHIQADALAEQTDYSDVDLLVLPGGMPGTLNLEANETVKRTVAEFATRGKKVAAICAAPSILGHLGLLRGKTATSYVGMRDQLSGATVVDREVVVDGNIITSFGLGGAIPFALELVKELAGTGEAERVRQAIEYLH